MLISDRSFSSARDIAQDMLNGVVKEVTKVNYQNYHKVCNPCKGAVPGAAFTLSKISKYSFR